MNNFEWCRKKKYEVEIELGCYLLTNDMTLIDGFFEKEFNGKKYAIKNGNNILEQNEHIRHLNHYFLLHYLDYKY